MLNTVNGILQTATRDYLKTVDPMDPPSAEELEKDLLEETRQLTGLENATRLKGDKIRLPNRLSYYQIASVVAHLYPVRMIAGAGFGDDDAHDLLGIYQADGPNAGIYVSSEKELRIIMRQFDVQICKKDVREIMTILGDMAERVAPCRQRNLIAVNNGIFDYDTKQLLPFSPDYVFTSKSRVDYNPFAQNLVIHNDEDGTDWDVESWMQSISDNEEVVNLLWEITGAIIRPNVPWNKSAWFYSESGNNGKGTLCELMRQLCGEGSYACIPLGDMGKNFALEPLLRTSAIIVDENDVGIYIDKAANLKAIITNDILSINRKFQMPVSYRYYGFMVQCLNELPRIKDKSDSFFRRQLFVPFTKCFTGIERKYIKKDYLHRKEVLEYVLYRVLHMNYYELSEPEVCKNALNEYREYNDPVVEFIKEVLPQCVWDLLPNQFLYDLYRAWFTKNVPSGSPLGKINFLNDLRKFICGTGQWISLEYSIKTGTMMDAPEPLILEYNLRDWMNPRYTGSPDTSKLCTTPRNKSKHKGFQRVTCNSDASSESA